MTSQNAFHLRMAVNLNVFKVIVSKEARLELLILYYRGKLSNQFHEMILFCQDSNGDQLSHFCQCKVGWKGENCDECEPAYECPTAKNETGAGIRACHLPGQCRCAGIRQKDNDEQHKRCTIWISGL